ncbi:hypothetical protein COEREDRAFT_83968 [Coemansia reversa NRRL 1564]|uniref:Mid2 domain-containing protein n=1 Tax=Coemansia reversa (strain ATCC 12441 / NRRL 1564) TaxID=763665 RepID=A0A2G5B0Z3_COERN|nr:hypothetical protein COEREDRAFT_83968 [Coemansia reversa NRRL 1564]|eukprot:PIA12686.1 hypothetical protein COEREDRAFT_83968 [Coemansia reversa NRRL 1564]
MRLQQVISISVVALAVALQVGGQDDGGILPILDLGSDTAAAGAPETTAAAEDPAVTPEVPPAEGDSSIVSDGTVTNGEPQPTDGASTTEEVPTEEVPTEEVPSDPPTDSATDQQPTDSSAENTEGSSDGTEPSDTTETTEGSAESTEASTPEESTTPTEESTSAETSEASTTESPSSDTLTTPSSETTSTEEETHTPSTKPTEEKSGSGGLSGGAIAGIVVAVVVVVLALIAYLIWRRYRNRKAFVDNAFDYNEFPEYDPGQASNANIPDAPPPVGYTDKSLNHQQQPSPSVVASTPGMDRHGDAVFDVTPHHHAINARDLDEA